MVINGYNYRYIPRPSKGSCFLTPILCERCWYHRFWERWLEASWTKKTLIFGFSDTQMTRYSLAVTPCRHALRAAKTTPLSLKGLRFGTPCITPRHANDSFDTYHFWGTKKNNSKIIASVVWDNKDELYIPDGPKQVENTLEIKGRRSGTPSLSVPKWHALACPGYYIFFLL